MVLSPGLIIPDGDGDHLHLQVTGPDRPTSDSPAGAEIVFVLQASDGTLSAQAATLVRMLSSV